MGREKKLSEEGVWLVCCVFILGWRAGIKTGGYRTPFKDVIAKKGTDVLSRVYREALMR